MNEVSLSLIGQEIKIISLKIRLHWDMRRTVRQTDIVASVMSTQQRILVKNINNVVETSQVLTYTMLLFFGPAVDDFCSLQYWL